MRHIQRIISSIIRTVYRELNNEGITKKYSRDRKINLGAYEDSYSYYLCAVIV